MCIRRLLTIVILVALGSGISADAGMSLMQSVDRAEVALNDSAVLEIVLTWSGSQADYRFERPLQPGLTNLRVGRFATTISSTGAGAHEVTTKRYVYSLVPTASGTGRVEPLAIAYISWPDSTPGELVTEPVTVSILPAPPVSESSGDPPFWLLLVVAVCLAGGGVAAVVVVRRRGRATQSEMTPADLLLTKLADLQKEAGADVKRFQTGLFRILVDYLEQRFSLPLHGKSAEEIEQAVVHTPLTENERDHILGWLKRAEREKFQPVQGSPGETIRLGNEIKTYFEKT